MSMFTKNVKPSPMAESIAHMLIEWIDAGLETGRDWRPGLARLIELRIRRFIKP